ncbi:MAG: DUF2461 domain-containing protein [Armatimonadota bacterium]
MNSGEHTFNGFFPKTLEFLCNLKANNNKEWFEAHKQEYQEYLLVPLQNLAADLSADMLAIDSLLVVGPKTVSRIYRDTRFSGNKGPYKTTMWLTFKRPRQDWMDAPAYFFEIAPSSYRYGMGFYSASPDTMRKFREMIDEKEEEFQEAISFYPKQKTFAIEGEIYKRIINESKSREIQDWYQRRNLYLVCNRKIDRLIFSGELAEDMISGFNTIAPLYRYLLKLRNS